MGDPFDLGGVSGPSLRMRGRRNRFSLGVGTLQLSQETRALIEMHHSRVLIDLWSRPNARATLDEILARRILELPNLDDDEDAIPRGRGPATARAATGGDLLGAIWGIPQVRNAADRTMDEVGGNLRRGWRRSSTGERVLLISHLAVIGGGTLTAILADDEARPFVLGLLAGVDIPVPWVDGLSFRVSPEGGGVTVPLSIPGLSGSLDATIDGNWTGRVSFDLMAFNRRRGR